jgi:glycerol-3-phosphate dehydrogenase
MAQHFDVAIIGGGVNGCGLARQLQGQGLSVYLCEARDLASGTSSASTKLIHGGLRYLEFYEFRLVREALSERETLLAMAPHIAWPLRFVLPHHRGLRPAWLLRLGLFLYDHLGGRKFLPATNTLDLSIDAAGAPLKERGRAFEYSDCWVEDSRLVALNAMDARARGAVIETRAQARAARRNGQAWEIDIETAGGGKTITARALVNAAGPWARQILDDVVHVAAPANVRLVQGSHIVTRRFFDHERCYIFQNRDGRIIFAIPYERDFTLIGTTDRDYHGDPADVAASEAEIEYLLAAANEYFAKPMTRADVVWTYSGVRPLYDDGASKAQEATRDYVLKLDENGAPLLSVFGGKITTYRRLAEHAAQMLRPYFPNAAREDWTAGKPLPGGDFAIDGFEALVRDLSREWPFVEAGHMRRLARAYGARVRNLLAGARRLDDLGVHFGADLYAREVDYLMQEEFARAADDILWRRSKLGLRLTDAQTAKLRAYIDANS